jgi:hypothetical protein
MPLKPDSSVTFEMILNQNWLLEKERKEPNKQAGKRVALSSH